mmetsp:Transcript_93772/g.286927  ORF Transcript_93772/g.286927 Transcript_93772/m.286927 type:complete len:234 (-) Transcript_93772:448-1149(-)
MKGCESRTRPCISKCTSTRTGWLMIWSSSTLDSGALFFCSSMACVAFRWTRTARGRETWWSTRKRRSAAIFDERSLLMICKRVIDVVICPTIEADRRNAKKSTLLVKRRSHTLFGSNRDVSPDRAAIDQWKDQVYRSHKVFSEMFTVSIQETKFVELSMMARPTPYHKQAKTCAVHKKNIMTLPMLATRPSCSLTGMYSPRWLVIFEAFSNRNKRTERTIRRPRSVVPTLLKL